MSTMSDGTNDKDTSPDPKPPRPWLRFSLKSLLLLTALVAVYFGGRASMGPRWDMPPTGT
jgi:hypothetical protein